MTIAKTTEKQRPGFQPGVSGNPRGRPCGSRHKATLAVLALLDGEAEELTRKAVELALDGDPVALRLCLERLCPPRRDSPVTLAGLRKIKRPEDLPMATAKILEAVGSGSITPMEGQVLSGLVEAHGRVLALAGGQEEDPANVTPNLQEFEERFRRRRAEVEQERAVFVPQRQKEIRELKESMGASGDSFAPQGDPGEQQG